MKKLSADNSSARVFIGVGSNLHDPLFQVRDALARIGSLEQFHHVESSSLFRNPPMGPAEQPDYVNAVVTLRTGLRPLEILDVLQSFEYAAGRERCGEHWGPRVLDLDLLLYDQLMLNTARLVIPHPGIAQRAFVLLPLYELCPTLLIPGHGPLEVLLEALDCTDLLCIGKSSE